MGGDGLKLLFSKLSQSDKQNILKNTNFNNVEDLVARIPKDINKSLTDEIIMMVKNEGIDLFSTREFDDKLDFGDLDFYTTTDKDLNPIIKKLFNPIVMKSNGGTITFSYKFSETQYFQIDFGHMTNLKLGMFVKSYADIGMILGMIASHNKLKFGEAGLFLKLNGDELNNIGKTTIFSPQEEMIFKLSTDVETIVLFFGLDYLEWSTGFENMEKAYNWLSKSPFYNPKYFINGEEKLKRHEKPKRKFMTGFEKYSEQLFKTNSHNFTNIDIVNYVFSFFKNYEKIMDEIKQIIETRETNKIRAEKFSGKTITNKGLIGKEIANCFKNFKIFIEDKYKNNFNEWIDNSDSNTINNIFESFFEENYKN